MSYLLVAQLQTADVDALGNKVIGFVIVCLFLAAVSWLANRRIVN